MAREEGGRSPAARVISIRLEDVPERAERGARVRVMVSPKTTGGSSYILGRAELAPGATDASHAHDYGEETIFVLQGKGVLRAHGEEFPLAPGSCLFIPRGIVHSVHNTGLEPIVVVFANGPLAPRPELGHREAASS